MTRLLHLLFLALLVIVAVGCDSEENPFLLNPPLPDSARVRVVNLLPSESVDVTVAGRSIAAGLATRQVSEFRNFLFVDRVPLMIRHGATVDTTEGQSLTAGAQITYVLLNGPTRPLVVPLQTGKVETQDLAARNVGRVVLLNATDDSTSLILKIGCQSGDTLIRQVPYGAISSAEVGPTELSLYLFTSRDSLLAASTHIEVAHGGVVYLIAHIENGRPVLDRLDATAITPGGPLPVAPPETENTATVEVLNAVGDGSSVSATLGADQKIATDLPSLRISPATTIQACVDPKGDSLAIVTGSGTFQVPISFSVRSQVLVVVYNKGTQTGAIRLSRNNGAADSVRIRVVDVSNRGTNVTVSLGAGAPGAWGRGGRPFQVMNTGDTTSYVAFGEGTFPVIVRAEGGLSSVLSGVQSLTNGYYTLFIVDQGGSPTLMLLRDDQPGSALQPLAQPASTVLFFNMMPDAAAQFTIGSLRIPDLAYSYVLSTALPQAMTTISSNAGNATADLTLGNYTVGATGTGGDRAVIAIPGPTVPITAGRASVRFLNAVKGSGELHVHIDTILSTPRAITTFGLPSQSQELDERKYSFRVTGADNGAELARIDGVEVTAGRYYLLVIGPKDPQSTNKLSYATLWLQE